MKLERIVFETSRMTANRSRKPNALHLTALCCVAGLMGWVTGCDSAAKQGDSHSGSQPTQAEPFGNVPFYAGADISALAKIESHGGTFKKQGVAGDAIKILRDEGVNLFRLRIFLAPAGNDVVVNDLAYTLALATRIKATNAKLLLDFHYSDTWADPGHQTKPAAWNHLGFDELKAAVEKHTTSVIAALVAQGTPPDMVQIGNEVTSGMLWDTGRIYKGNHDIQWQQFTDLLKAGIRGVHAANPLKHDIKIIIHIDKGSDWGATEHFYHQMEIYHVDYEIIGLSYYPWWHGTMADVATNFYNASRRFGKPLLMVETAYPMNYSNYWQSQPNMAWPVSEAGQAAYLQALTATVRQSAGAKGLGVVYWYPEAIVVPGLSVWNDGATALFGSDGEVNAGAAAMTPSR